MNTINSNYNVNYFSNAVNNINSADNNDISLKEISKETNNKDSIEISQKNQNIINTKKALDVFHEVSSEYQSIQVNSFYSEDLSGFYLTADEMMKDAGIDVPSFVLDGSNTVDFISHAEKLKEFVKNLNIERPGSFPDELLDFCDSFKERLIQYDCK